MGDPRGSVEKNDPAEDFRSRGKKKKPEACALEKAGKNI
jgi:hypothetical protein